jgi:Cu+-exporting ATPase
LHPEIVRDEPGDCPKCGMALEPMGVPAGEEGPNPELLDFTRRFRIGVLFSLAAPHPTMLPWLGSVNCARHWRRCRHVAEFLLGTPVVIWAGWPFLVRGAKSSQHESQHVQA